MAAQPGRHAVLFGERSHGQDLARHDRSGVHRRPDRVRPRDGRARRHVRLAVAPCARSRCARSCAAPSAASPPRRSPSDTPTTLGRDGDPTIAEVLTLLARVSAGAPAWIVFDDFDRVKDDRDAIADARGGGGHRGGRSGRDAGVLPARRKSGDDLLQPSASLVPVHVTRLTIDESLECLLRGLRQAGIVRGRCGRRADRGARQRSCRTRSTRWRGRRRMTTRAAGGTNLESPHLDAGVRVVLADTAAEVRHGLRAGDRARAARHLSRDPARVRAVAARRERPLQRRRRVRRGDPHRAAGGAGTHEPGQRADRRGPRRRCSTSRARPSRRATASWIRGSSPTSSCAAWKRAGRRTRRRRGCRAWPRPENPAKAA